MAEERINDIISQEAFEQVKQLAAELVALNNIMNKTIQDAQGVKDAVSQATSFKDAVNAMNQASSVTSQYVKTSSERLNIERQIKAEGEKMVKVLQDEEKTLDDAIIAMNRKRKSDEELAVSVVKIETALQSQKKQLKELKDEYGTYGKMNGEQRARIAELTTSIGELNVKRSEMLRQLKEDANLTQAAPDSYRAMNAQLVMLRNAYKSLSEEEMNAVDIGGAMRDAINSLDEKLKAIDKTIGLNQRNVGNYDVLLNQVLSGEINMRSALRELQQELTNQELKRRLLGQSIDEQQKKVQNLLATEGAESDVYKTESQSLDEMKKKYDDMGTAINDLEEKTGMLRDTQADVQRTVKNEAMDAGGVKATLEGVSLLTQSYNALNAVMAISGADSQKLADIYNKMMIIQNGVNAVNKIANTLQKESILRIKIRSALDKARLIYLKANTQATVTETVAEKANTQAKKGNAAATVGATAATGALAAGEGVATATSFTLAGALKAVGLAIKSIPVIGWILAAVSALATLTGLVYKHITAEKELTAEETRRKEVTDGLNDAKKEALSNTAKEAIEMDRSVEKIHSLKEGTEEYNAEVKKVADKLGVSDKWLSKNISKVDSLAAAWKRVRYVQALTDALLSKAADAQVKAFEKSMELQDKSEKQRKKQLREEGYSRRDAKRMAQQQNIADTMKRTIDAGRKNAEAYLKEIDRIEEENKDSINEVLNAQKEGAKESEKTTKGAVEKQKKDMESAKEYYKGILKQMADDENKQLSKNTKHRLQVLEKQQAQEAAKYKIGQNLSEEERTKIAEYYSKKRKEIMDDEARSIIAAYAVVTENYINLNKKFIQDSKLNGKQLVDALANLEDASYIELQKKREEDFNKSVEGLEKNSAAYIAEERKYRSVLAKDEADHQNNMEKIRSDALAKSLNDVRNFYSAFYHYTKDEDTGDLAKGPITSILLKLQEAEQQRAIIEEQFRKLREDSLGIYGFDVYEMNRALELAATEGEDIFKRMWDTLTAEQQKLVETFQKTEEEARNNAQNIRTINEDLVKSYVSVGSGVADSLISIGDSMKSLFGDSVEITIGQQAIAMAQVLANQAVAISEAVKAVTAAAAESPNKTMAVIQLVATMTSSIAAILSQMASAKQAIEQSRAAVAEARGVSAYADGTEHHQGGDALVGEGGVPEIVTSNGKSYVIDRPTLIRDLPVGSKVTPVDDGTMNAIDLSGVIDAMGRIERRDRVQVNVGKDVYTYIVSGASRTRILNRQFCH